MQDADFTILIVTRDEKTLNLLESLQEEDTAYNLIFVTNLKDFFSHLNNKKIDMVIFDPDVRDMNATEAFIVAKEHHPKVPAIYLFEEEDYSTAHEMVDKGVIFRLLKPLKKQELKEICDRAVEFKSVKVIRDERST